MQLDTRLPLLAAQQPALQFQRETQLESLGKIAPAINAMRQMQAQQQTQQQEMQRMMQRSAALDEMRRAMQDEDLGKYAQALINSGDETLMQKGAQLQMADLQDKQFRRQFGGMTGNLTPEGMAALAGAGEKGLGMAKELGRYVVTPQPFAVGKNVFVPGQGFQAPPEAPTPQPQPQVLRRGDVLIDPATGERIATNVPANALIPGAAPAPAGTQPARPSAGAAGGAPAAGRPMSEGELARRRDAVGKEYRNARTSLQNLQDTLNSAELVRNAPGLERATGFSGVYLPSFTGGAAAQAQTRLENLRGKITAMGKATAAMSGAIGSIANQEWKILADQIAVIDPVKGAGPMLEQISLLEQQARDAMKRIKDAYEKQFGEDFERFPQFRELPMPAQGAGLSVPRTPAPAAPAARPRSGVAAPASAPSSGGWSVVR